MPVNCFNVTIHGPSDTRTVEHTYLLAYTSLLHLSSRVCYMVTLALSEAMSLVIGTVSINSTGFQTWSVLNLIQYLSPGLWPVSPLLNSDFAMKQFGIMVSIILIISDYWARIALLYLEQRDMPLKCTHTQYITTSHRTRKPLTAPLTREQTVNRPG